MSLSLNLQLTPSAGIASIVSAAPIKKHAPLGQPWEPGSEELTPTMKLRRKPIGETYAVEIEARYR
jgi:long-subunit acyl-CoA synthetase (AMP-forming)